MFREMIREDKQLPTEVCRQLLIEEKRGILSVIGEDGYPYGTPMNHWYDEESGKLAYFVDWNEEKENGTLKVYNGKKSTKVSDDVYNCVFSADGKILYLYDYSTNYYKGDLYVFNKGKSKKMDIDVSAIIPVIK